jgi:hypothetical protein
MRDISPFGLRIPDDLKTRLEDAAARNRRSLNSEMLARLEASFAGPLDDYSDGELIAELMSRYGRGEIYVRVGILTEDAGNADHTT